jgi:hypothetical protein
MARTGHCLDFDNGPREDCDSSVARRSGGITVRHSLQCGAVVLGGLLSTCAIAGSPNYEAQGRRPASGRIETPGYVFEYGAPPGLSASAEWHYMVDADEPRTIALLAGVKGMDSYALSVTYKGAVEAGQSALDVATKIHPGVTFAASTVNPACVTTAPNSPIELDRTMVSFHAICVDAAAHAVYEIGYSWNSLFLLSKGLATLTEESGACASRKRQDPSVSCEDFVGSFVTAYRDALGGLTFSPRK